MSEYQNGYDAGLKQGYNDGIRECMNILAKDLSKFKELLKSD